MEHLLDDKDDITIFSLTQHCHDLFESILSARPQLSEIDEIETQFGRLNIWTSNIGALAPGTSSLDHRLRFSHDFKSMVLQMLEVLDQNLRQLKNSAADIDDPDADMGVQLYTKALGSIEASLNRLQTLAVVIRRSSAQSKNFRSRPFSDGNDEDDFERFVITVLRHRFKEANGSLVEQLADSIALRRRQFDYKIRHQRKLAQNITVLKAAATPQTAHVHTQSNIQPNPKLKDTLMQLSTPSQYLRNELTSQSYGAPSITEASVFISELGRKNLKLEDYRRRPPPSITSKGASIQNPDLEYPPPPTCRPGQIECICPYCCEILVTTEVSNKRWWKHHVDADVEPYSCISEECSSLPINFRKYEEWLDHMSKHGPPHLAWNVHLKMFRCPLCMLLEPFRWKDDLLTHMRHQHPDRYTETQLLALSRRSTVSVIRDPHVCPLCNCVPENIAKITYENRERIRDLLPKHIEEHLKSLAFMSLPYRSDIEDRESGASRELTYAVNSRPQSRGSISTASSEHSWYSDSQAGYSRALRKRQEEMINMGITLPQPIPDLVDEELWGILPLAPYEWENDNIMKHFEHRQSNNNTLKRDFNDPKTVKEESASIPALEEDIPVDMSEGSFSPGPEDQLQPNTSQYSYYIELNQQWHNFVTGLRPWRPGLEHRRNYWPTSVIHGTDADAAGEFNCGGDDTQLGKLKDPQTRSVPYLEVEHGDTLGWIASQPNGAFRELSFLVVSWALYAKRPLNRGEIMDACRIYLSRYTSATSLIYICDSLAERMMTGIGFYDLVRFEDERCVLANFGSGKSKKAFREAWEGLWETDPQWMITETCISCATSEVFQAGACATEEEFITRMRENPFYQYAAENWGHHARDLEERGLYQHQNSRWTQGSLWSWAQYWGYPTQRKSTSVQEPRRLTPFHLLAFYGLYKAFRDWYGIYLQEPASLLENDVDIKDPDGRTPLMWAVAKGYSSIVELLLFNGANIRATDDTLRSLLSHAAGMGRTELVRMLVKYGANPGLESPDKLGRTALLWAAHHGHPAIVTYLAGLRSPFKVQEYSLINIPDKAGRTPISYAAGNGDPETVSVLLSLGADPSISDLTGKDAFQWAVENEHYNTQSMLSLNMPRLGQSSSAGASESEWQIWSDIQGSRGISEPRSSSKTKIWFTRPFKT